MKNIIMLCIKLITLVVSVRCQMCTDLARFGSDISDGVQLIATPIAQVRTAGLVVCMKTCLQYKLCEHINFNKKNNECNLLPRGELKGEENTDIISSSRTKWPNRILIGPCFDHECPASTRCAVQDGRAVCDVIGCSDVPGVSGANDAGFEMKPLWNINDVITSPCSPPLIPSNAVICQSDGHWTEFSCTEKCTGLGENYFAYEEKCVWKSSDVQTWDDSKRACEEGGWSLLQTKDGTQHFGELLVVEGLHGGFWIGGRKTNYIWRWLDGSIIPFADGKWSRPTGFDCLQFGFMEWKDHECGHKFHFLCEIILK